MPLRAYAPRTAGTTAEQNRILASPAPCPASAFPGIQALRHLHLLSSLFDSCSACCRSLTVPPSAAECFSARNCLRQKIRSPGAAAMRLCRPSPAGYRSSPRPLCRTKKKDPLSADEERGSRGTASRKNRPAPYASGLKSSGKSALVYTFCTSSSSSRASVMRTSFWAVSASMGTSTRGTMASWASSISTP